MPSPISGYHSPGQRFKARIRSIAHINLYLPIEMRSLPQISKLMEGVSPLAVFNCNNISDARNAFYELRKKYDFSYWAALEYKVKDLNYPQKMVPFRLNPYQHILVDKLLKQTADGSPKKFVISKTVPKCGLTTCVQAFILWRQIYHQVDSITYTNLDFDRTDMINNVAKGLGKQAGRKGLYLNKQGNFALFHAYRSPEELPAVPCSLIHIADMAKWYDPSGNDTKRILINSLRYWTRKETALFILEGDFPKDHSFKIQDYQNNNVQEAIRLLQLSGYSQNPAFLNEIVKASDPHLIPTFSHLPLP